MDERILWPERITLARTPTPLEPLDRISAEAGTEIWVKRDDLTGLALSGNKVRKLEFLMREALDLGARTVYTCGGIQSNHARATAAAATKLGLGCRLFLRGTEPARSEGNVLLDRMLGAEITWITPEQYRGAVELMTERARSEKRGGYVIPEGGSTALGCLGYARAVREIVQQERRHGIEFDAVVHAVGSGGTLAGLVLGREAFGLRAEVFAVNVCDDEKYFVDRVGAILEEAVERYAPTLSFSPGDIRVLDGYVGPGYAQSTPEQLATIRRAALTEGLLLDPAYSGKAFHGMLREICAGALSGFRRILFVHTGGVFSLFARSEELLGN